MVDIFVEAFASNPDAYSDFLMLSGCSIGIFIGLLGGSLLFVTVSLHEFCCDYFKERKAKKSGKLTNEQRLELLEEKIDSLADIVISTSEEVK